MDEGARMQGDEPIPERGQDKDLDEQRDGREPALADDLAGAAEPVDREGDPDIRVEATAQDHIGVVGEPDVAIPQVPQGTAERESIDEPDHDVRIAVEGGPDWAELPLDRRHVARPGVDEADTDASV